VGACGGRACGRWVGAGGQAKRGRWGEARRRAEGQRKARGAGAKHRVQAQRRHGRKDGASEGPKCRRGLSKARARGRAKRGAPAS
jgi:hypothetical protein